MKTSKPIISAFGLISADEDARVCKDIPESACRHQARNALAYMLANLFNKIADELTSAKLILPWLLASIGAPAALSGFLVPIREAGVLLPQLVVAAFIRRMPIRKTVWLWGGALSALSLASMALVVAGFSGASAGWLIIASLILFSLARGLCSVSAKDVLGKTVSKGMRGSVMGYSAGLAGIVTLGFGFYVQWFTASLASRELLIALLLISTLLWLLALFSFAAIKEHPGATEGGGNAIVTALRSFRLLQTDKVLRSFIITRVYLLSVALAPPFYVMLAQQRSSGGVSDLGLLIIASGLASSISAPVWGRLGDWSSRYVMMLASLVAGILGVAVFSLAALDSVLLSYSLFHALLYLILIVVHSGVRLGRKVYLVDLATAETRAAYVAVSNTVIGVAMLIGGLIGILADVWSLHYLILLLGLLGLAAGVSAWRLPEVSQ